jgi:hypothetical protein
LSENGQHEFLFFIKPEITRVANAGSKVRVLEMIMKKIDSFDLKIKRIIMLAAPYLERHNIIGRHYGIINALAANAKADLTDKAKSKFNEQFNCGYDESTIYGGLEMLAAFPDLTPVSLDYLWQNSPVVKLGGGAYCQTLKIDGRQLFLVNGFHPRQLEHYTASGQSIIAFTLTGNLDWNASRNRFIGKTNPAEAEPGSIRHTLLENRNDFGLQTVNSSWNGVHLSAGPVESLVELIRYNSDFDRRLILGPSDFSFGRQLEDLFGKNTIQKIMDNPTIDYKGRKDNIFDLTEEKNYDEALKILGELFT